MITFIITIMITFIITIMITFIIAIGAHILLQALPFLYTPSRFAVCC